LLLAVLTVPQASPSSSAATAESCFGQVPTAVGTPGKPLIGTELPDVVVTNGSDGVDTRGGDDLVCVSGLVRGQYLTGSGDDRIDSTLAQFDAASLWIEPGPGMDEVSGTTAGHMYVISADTDADVIATGSASDDVYADRQDTVSLGAGFDFLNVDLDGEVVGGSYDGGTGADELTVKLQLPDGHPAWTIDNVSQRILRDDTVIAGVRSFSLFRAMASGPLTFVGSDGAERLSTFGVNENRVPKWPLHVSMNGGQDTVVFNGGAPGAVFDGGEGTDWFVYRRSYRESYPYRLTFDLASGLLRDRQGTSEVTRQAVGFENVRSEEIGKVTIKGTSGPNVLQSRWGWKATDRSVFAGRAGDDVLVGSDGYDELIGGSGQDVVRGGAGVDRCEGETRIGCER
jgi:Ca2+-binding RTX toxin-like protein